MAYANIEDKREAARRFRNNNLESERLRERLSARKRYKKIKKTRKFNTPKVKARALLTQAVFYGKIRKPSKCQRCSIRFDKKHIHGHHHDYSKPYDVRWLCTSCHGYVHRIAKEALQGEKE